jgi:hypothetical protein
VVKGAHSRDEHVELHSRAHHDICVGGEHVDECREIAVLDFHA